MTRPMTLGALGGPETFNGQAAKLIAARYPEFTETIYYPTSDEAMAAAMRGEVTATCAPEHTSKTGFHLGMHARLTSPTPLLYVIAEASRGYGCSLLGKPGAKLAQVRRVLGHTGSIAHSRAWIAAHLPHADVQTVDTNSRGAVDAVLSSDGTVAAVGTLDLACNFGLAELARQIDDGSVVNYWAVSLEPRFSDRPTRMAITARFGDDAQLTELICSVADIGYAVQALHPRPTGAALDEYDYVMRFRGTGDLGTVRRALAPFPTARLAGAWEART